MHLILMHISTIFVLFSATFLGNALGHYAPLEFTNNEILLFAVNAEKYTDEKGVLTENIMMACSPESTFEEASNVESNTGNSLIVKKFLKKGDAYIKKAYANFCKKEITPSSIFDEKFKAYRIGYEITDSNDLINIPLDKMDKPQFFEGNYGWVQVYGVSINDKDYKFSYLVPDSTDVVSVLGPLNLCQKFEVLENEAVDKLVLDLNEKLNVGNQKIKHVDDKGTSKHLQQSKADTDEETRLLGNNKKSSIVEVYLAEPEDFDNYYSKLSTCFKINASLIWEPVFNGAWKKVGNFMRHVNNKLSKQGEIRLFKAVEGKLMLLANEESKARESLPEIYSPNVFWHFISFKAKNKVTYGIFIVIHNNINESMNRLCEKDICNENGWEVENDNFRSGETYCCEPAKINSKKIKTGDFAHYEPFNLKKLL